MLSQDMHRNGTLLLRFTEDIGLTKDIQELYEVVRRAVDRGHSHFAIAFTPDTFLHSHHVAVVIKCIERIREAGGALSIIRPNNDIADMLSFVDPDGFTMRVQSEEELPPPRVPNPTP